MNIEEMVSRYVKLRDRIAAKKKEHIAELAPYNLAMATLEGMMLDTLNAAGAENMRTASGTAYKATSTSTKVTDWPQTLAFIKEKEAWDLLEARVSKTAAAAIMEETQAPIPGVTTTREIVVNVRKS